MAVDIKAALSNTGSAAKFAADFVAADTSPAFGARQACGEKSYQYSHGLGDGGREGSG